MSSFTTSPLTGRWSTWLLSLSLARVLDGAAVVITSVLAVTAAGATAVGLFGFARDHQQSSVAAGTFAVVLVGLWALLTSYCWRARLRRGRVSPAGWVLLCLVVGAAVAACASGDTFGARVVAAAPAACLPALTVLLSTGRTIAPTRGEDAHRTGATPEGRRKPHRPRSQEQQGSSQRQPGGR